jgi:antitoxin StbD
MTTKASASDVQKNFGAFHDQALSEPVQVTRYGRESVYIVSARTYHELRQSYRRALSASELTEEELALIDAAEVPPEHRYSLKDVD